MAAPILDLDKLTDRPTVIIDGTEHWLLTPDILPPLDGHRVQRMSARVSELLGKGVDLTRDEEQELDLLPDRLCRLVLEAPDEVHQKLDNRKRMLIAETAMTTFRSGLRLNSPNPGPPPPAATTSSTGAT